MANPTPPANATTTTLQVGTYTALTDAFSLVLDLNDHATFFLHPQGLKLDQPEKIYARGNNIRTPGERIARTQYKNRKIQASLWLGRKLTYAQLAAAWRGLIQAVEHPPYVLRLALPGASAYTYADVVAVTHNIPSDPQLILNGTLTHIEVTFECLPYLRGDRLTLSNLVSNPGFEAPSGPGVTVFSDPFTNFNAYTVVAGGALTADTTTYADTVLGDQPLRYYRLDEGSGTTAYDATGSGNNGTYSGGYTPGQAGALTGDSDTATLFNGTSGYVSAGATGLPTSANAACSLECWVKLSATPTATVSPLALGKGGTNGQELYLAFASSASPWAGNGTVNSSSAPALSLNAWHHLVATYDGTNITLYADGTLVSGPTAASITLSYGGLYIGQLGNSSDYFPGSVDEVAVYGTALSASQVSAHYAAGHSGPASAAGTMLVPSNATVTFGSSAWGAVNTWQVLTRTPSGTGSVTCMLHRTDANNWLGAQLLSGVLALTHCVGGVQHNLGNTSLSGLVPGVRYWLTLTQFPSVAGVAPQVQVSLANRAGSGTGAGTVGSTIALVGPVATYDAVTALSGVAALNSSGTSFAVDAHTLALFGPGNWYNADVTTSGYTVCACAWEQNTSNTLAAGPVTSFGAARIDVPSVGYYNVSWIGGIGFAATNAQSTLCPVATAGDTLGLAAWVRTSAGMSANGTQAIGVNEYDANGTFLRQGLVASMTRSGPTNQGVNGGWTQLTGSYTTGAGCVYAAIYATAYNGVVAGQDAGQTIWFDNVQVWDQTATGQTSMPYCELRFPQSPAMLLVSGVQGDGPAPAFLAAGTYLLSFAAGTALQLLLGRAAYALRGAQLVGIDNNINAGVQTQTLAGNAYGGRAVATNMSVAGYHAMTTLSVAAAAVRGQFHVLARLQTAATTLSNVVARVRAYEQSSAWASRGVASGDQAEYYTAYFAPFTSNNWQIVDAGYLPLPAFPATSLGDPTQIYYEPMLEIDDNNTTKATLNSNWGALLPVDAAVLAVTLNNPSNSINTPANSWEWMYVDGLAVPVTGQAALNWSAETLPSPNPAHAYGGQVAQSTGPINLFASGDSFLTLDPAPLSIAGDTAASAGVNQFSGLIAATSNNNDTFALYTELQYSPRFLYPK